MAKQVITRYVSDVSGEEIAEDEEVYIANVTRPDGKRVPLDFKASEYETIIVGNVKGVDLSDESVWKDPPGRKAGT